MTSAAYREPRDLPAGLGFLAGGGEATRLILQRDWSHHVLGPPQGWSEALKAALSTVLNSPESMILAWGRDDLTFFFNETYFPLLGPRLSWAMGAPFTEVWADAWAQAKPIIDEAFAGRSQRFEDLPWKLGTDRGASETWWTFSYSRILDARGGIAGLFIFTNETTARVLADAALRELNATLEHQVAERTADRNRLWQLSSDIMLVASFDGVIEAVNPAWTRVLGWSAEELIGRRLFDFIHPDDLPHTLEGASGIGRGETFANFENRYLHKDGSYRDISWAAGPGDDRIIAVGRDQTEEKARTAALAAAEESLRQSQKMEAVGQLTGGLAHDFNNLLAGVSGALELMNARIAQGRVQEVGRYIEAAQGAAKRAAALTHRLLAFSRRQTLAPKPTDVNALVDGMTELIQRTVGPSIEVERKSAEGLWTVMVDAPQLENALLNLCINARDAMPDGGRIVIETSNRTLSGDEPDGHDLAAGQYLSLCVSDTGTGMPADVIAKAFEPFFTTKPIGEGTGLGLSMIYGFARQSGGQVRISSEVGQGTTVCIHLPRHHGEAEEDRRAAPGAAFAPSQRGGTVLVVDDEATVRMLVADVLGDLGYDTVEAADSAGGLHVLQSDAKIDLLVTDVGLPGGMNGRQMADAGRAARPGLNVLFITGYAETAVLRDALLEPGMAVLTKPFALEDLAARVKNMVEPR